MRDSQFAIRDAAICADEYSTNTGRVTNCDEWRTDSSTLCVAVCTAIKSLCVREVFRLEGETQWTDANLTNSNASFYKDYSCTRLTTNHALSEAALRSWIKYGEVMIKWHKELHHLNYKFYTATFFLKLLWVTIFIISASLKKELWGFNHFLELIDIQSNLLIVYIKLKKIVERNREYDWFKKESLHFTFVSTYTCLYACKRFFEEM